MIRIIHHYHKVRKISFNQSTRPHCPSLPQSAENQIQSIDTAALSITTTKCGKSHSINRHSRIVHHYHKVQKMKFNQSTQPHCPSLPQSAENLIQSIDTAALSITTTKCGKSHSFNRHSRIVHHYHKVRKISFNQSTQPHCPSLPQSAENLIQSIDTAALSITTTKCGKSHSINRHSRIVHHYHKVRKMSFNQSTQPHCPSLPQSAENEIQSIDTAALSITTTKCGKSHSINRHSRIVHHYHKVQKMKFNQSAENEIQSIDTAALSITTTKCAIVHHYHKSD